MSRVRVALVTAGLAAVAYGGYGIVGAPGGPQPLRYLLFLATVLLGHDLLVVPAALLIGALIGRFVPVGLRGLLRAGMLVSATVGLVALPFVLHRGYRPHNPSALPLDYAHGLLIVLAAVWLGIATVTIVRRLLRGG